MLLVRKCSLGPCSESFHGEVLVNSLRNPLQVGERMSLAVTGPHSKHLCHMVVTKIGVSHVRPLARAHGDESSISIL